MRFAMKNENGEMLKAVSLILRTVMLVLQKSHPVSRIENPLFFTVWKIVMALELRNCIFFEHIPIQFFRHICYIS